jgi:SAM hydroxide adenosyltransferase N-terminal domain
MIVLFTDFGLHGPYTGQVKAVLHRMAGATPVIDLFADAPVGNPKASAYLLAAYAEWFQPGTIFLAVVDPGVGGARPAVILEADGRWYVGPGNGLLELVERRASSARCLLCPLSRREAHHPRPLPPNRGWRGIDAIIVQRWERSPETSVNILSYAGFTA